MELLITCYACKSASCKRVIGVIPYMPYSRHSEFEPLSVIPSPLLQGRERRCHGTPSHGVRLQDLHREGALAFIIVAHFHLKVLKKVLVFNYMSELSQVGLL